MREKRLEVFLSCSFGTSFFSFERCFFTWVFLRGFYVGFDAGVCGDTDFFCVFLWGKLGDMIVLMSWRNVESWCRLRRGDGGKEFLIFILHLRYVDMMKKT